MSTDPFDPLDHRASRARESLVRHVGPVDAAGPRSDLEARHRRQRSDRRRARLAAAAVTVVALVGGGALLSVTGPGDPDDREIREELAVDDAEGRALLENLPSSPIDGKESWRLPVGVSPQTGLRDGDLVTIYGRGFEPNDSLGVVHCSAEADTRNAGVDACQLGADQGFAPVQYVSADAAGNVVAQVQVRRFIETPGFGRVDCASAAERCLLGMGAISNYDRSGGVYIDFEGAPEFPVPALGVTGADDGITPGQEVAVQVTGWVPERMLRLQQCAAGSDGLDADDPCETVLDTRADGGGNLTTPVVLDAVVVAGGREHPCADICVLQATGIGVPEGTTAPFPDPVPLRFTTSDGEATTTTPDPTAPTATTAPAVTAPAGTEPPTTDTAPAPVLPEGGALPGSTP